MAKITYTDKVALNPQPSIADENKVTDSDMNEIKSVVNGLIVNEYSESQENAYSCDYVNGLNTYSTTEKRIGTWIDGKPVYQKTIDFGSNPNNTTKSVAHGISNLGRIIKCDGFTRLTTGVHTEFPIPYPSRDSGSIISLTINDTSVNITAGYDATGYYTYVILEYTKTTD